MMRVTSSVTSVSWIPSSAVTGTLKVPFIVGIDHYDPPPPDVIGDVDDLLAQGRVRIVNDLRAWIDVVGGAITGAGYAGRGHLGTTTLRFGVGEMTLANVAFPDLKRAPEFGDGWVRFTQTAGGRTAAPAPRRVNRAPYVQIVAPTAWTTLTLTMHADGFAHGELVGASPFPRHWVYDAPVRLSPSRDSPTSGRGPVTTSGTGRHGVDAIRRRSCQGSRPNWNGSCRL
jgi:hypothetical protein